MFLVFLIPALLFFKLASPVQAFCPVCTVAIGAGLGLSRWLRIDDLLSGLWVGGFLISSALWLSNWLTSKKIFFPFKKIVCILVFYLLTLLPLYYSGMIGHPLNTFLGIDKIIFGSVTGSILFLIALGIDKYLRSLNNGKVFIYYQKVFLPVWLLLIASFVFYLIIK